MRQITSSSGICGMRLGPARDAPDYQRREANRSPTAQWLWWLASAVCAAATMPVLTAALPTGQVGSGSETDFYVSLQTDTRHDHAGLSTVVVAGQNRFVFDCGQTESAPVPENADAVRALFLTRIDDATTNGLERLVESARNTMDAESPLRVWGPTGTSEWMQRRGVSLTGGPPERQLTVVDLKEGLIAESDGLTVLAIAIDEGHFAYRVTYNDQSILIATDVTLSPHLVELARDADVAIVRHTAERSAAAFLNSARPRLAVLVQDGVPASATGIRERYRGALQMVPPGARRVDVPIRNGDHEPAPGDRR